MDHQDPNRIWDEYDWERFLRQQDFKTEKYMELMEKYMDDPNRDQIVAREMGWYHLLEGGEDEWEDEVSGQEADELLEDDEEVEYQHPESLEKNPLYQASCALMAYIDQLFDTNPVLQNNPLSVRMATQAAVSNAKLVAALSDEEVDEIGMTIAYLKRALKAITEAMQFGIELQRELKLPEELFTQLNQRFFQIRDGIIVLMGEFRSEWRRRYDNN